MHVIPVIDIRAGEVVHAMGGDRAGYKPIRTPLAEGCELKDATAWNVIFAGSRPVFCDHLSFRPLPSRQWWAFGQFLRQQLESASVADRTVAPSKTIAATAVDEQNRPHPPPPVTVNCSTFVALSPASSRRLKSLPTAASITAGFGVIWIGVAVAAIGRTRASRREVARKPDRREARIVEALVSVRRRRGGRRELARARVE